jgi:hypothetical protein
MLLLGITLASLLVIGAAPPRNPSPLARPQPAEPVPATGRGPRFALMREPTADPQP